LGNSYPVSLEEGELLGQHVLPNREVGFEMFSIAILVRVLKLIEGGIFSVQQLAIPPQEVLVERTVQNGPLEVGFRVFPRRYPSWQPSGQGEFTQGDLQTVLCVTNRAIRGQRRTELGRRVSSG